MKSVEREALWQERVQEWRGSGLSQRAFALKHGYPVRQVGYWVRRLAESQSAPLMLPVTVSGAVAPSTAINLRSERGWTVTLPADVPAAWRAELLRTL